MNDARLLQVCYWTLAAADFLFAAVMLFPARAGTGSYVYPMGLFSAVAVAWGVLLAMAARRPVERRWVLLPTLLVIVLLAIASLTALATGVIDMQVVVPRLVLKLALVVFLVFTWIKTRAG